MRRRMTGPGGPRQERRRTVRSIDADAATVRAWRHGGDAGTESTVMIGQGVSEVLPFAIGIAISPVPIIAIILILFSNRATVNGLSFLVGWMLGLAVVGTAVYLFADAANAATDSTTSDSISWGKIALGVLLLGLARRNFAKRPT